MKKSYVIGFAISMGLLMWFLIDEGHASYPLKQAPLNDKKPISTPPAQQRTLSQPVTKATTKTSSVTQSAFDEDLAKAASVVADQYQKSLAFPPYSQPLTVYDEDRLKPNQFFPVSSPVGEQGGGVNSELV